MSGHTEFVKAIEQEPLDPGLHQIFSDWLEEQGRDQEAKRERAIAAYRKGEVVPTDQYWTVITTLYESLAWVKSRNVIEGLLERVNGRRRTRTLNMRDVMECVVKAARDEEGWHFVGGTVANAYNYPSRSTVCVAARRTDGKVRMDVAETTGSNERSPTTAVTGLAKNSKPEAFRRWADGEDSRQLVMFPPPSPA
jgi:uncharacterized protein (TIGR02996 family)